MHLESTHLDFILPHFVMELDIVQDGVDQALDVRVFVREEL